MPLSIAEVSEYTGLTAHTLRYYERAGLMILDVERTSSGHRSYSADAVEAIVMITRLRSTGMPIRDVRAYVRLCREGPGNEADRLELLRAHQERMLGQLDELHGHLQAVGYKIRLYDGRLHEVCSGSEGQEGPEGPNGPAMDILSPDPDPRLRSSALQGVESPP